MDEQIHEAASPGLFQACGKPDALAVGDAVIIEWFITTGNNNNIHDVNETLYQFDQLTLGV